MKRLSNFQLFFFVLSFLSCGVMNPPKLVKTYDGPALPENEVGQIVYDYKAPGLRIKAIDGRYYREILDAVGFDSSEDNFGGYGLLHGEHLIKVVGLGEIYGIRTHIIGEWLFKLLVEPGHKYKLSYKIGKKIKGTGWYKVDVFFRDTKTKEVIKPEKKIINKELHIEAIFLR